MAYAKVYIQKDFSKGETTNMQTKEVVSSFGIYCKDIPFLMYSDVKEPYSNDWLDEDGIEEYIPKEGLKMKPYDMEVEWAYKGAMYSANDKIKKFLDYLSGRSDNQPQMAIYCDYTKIGRYKIRLSKISDKVTLVRDKDNGDIVIFKTTLKVCDPVTEFVYDPFIEVGPPEVGGGDVIEKPGIADVESGTV